jgi:hypothetical protein
MARRRDRTAGARTGRRDGRARIAAWLGVLALLVQALLPAAAMAAQSGAARGEQIVVCTLTGVKTVTLGEHDKTGKGFAGLPCHDCLAATIAALPAPEPALEPIAYTLSVIEHAPERGWAPQLARAPPRPPGQGPPQA